MEQCLAGYRALEYDVEQIVNRIKTERAYTKPAQKMLDDAQKKKKILVCNPPEIKQDKALIEKFVIEINKELPPNSFYIPEDYK